MYRMRTFEVLGCYEGRDCKKSIIKETKLYKGTRVRSEISPCFIGNKKQKAKGQSESSTILKRRGEKIMSQFLHLKNF